MTLYSGGSKIGVDVSGGGVSGFWFLVLVLVLVWSGLVFEEA